MSNRTVSNEGERRVKQRRVVKDRRAKARFGDTLGRRSGLDRRIKAFNGFIDD